MEYIRDFTALDKEDVKLAGGKGASLGEMTQAGMPVPPGFVVLTSCFEQFLIELKLSKESENIQELIMDAMISENISAEILKSFKKLDTLYVAIRSSATSEDSKDHSWAGQLESYLNVKEEAVLEKVRQCWASLFTPRAIFYRSENGLDIKDVSVAVVIQKMVKSEMAGIAFSVHPVTEDHNQIIIEAGFGLGEGIVSGQVTPDSYVIEKNSRKIIDIKLSDTKKILNDMQIIELSEIVISIEEHYGFPCDIEWAFEKGKFYIVQSRPITTLTY
jgi:pyruvate, water dikinase